ncbi:MAG: hypothetical protein M1823_005589 [Watsoniomyces obsoletus]|nr:MAG: hypothetical protein M1823_005589 [Watsoniomyces obsoletus]
MQEPEVPQLGDLAPHGNQISEPHVQVPRLQLDPPPSYEDAFQSGPDQSGNQSPSLDGHQLSGSFEYIVVNEDLSVPARPRSAASTDTRREAATAFLDFDGVHYKDRSETSTIRSERVEEADIIGPTGQPLPDIPLQAPPNEGMIYYPAPVPTVIKLPQRLSKLPPAVSRDDRRSQVLEQLLPGDRQRPAQLGPPNAEGQYDVAAPPETLQQRRSLEPGRTLETLPPQLRASAYFDHPSFRQDVTVKEDSAVATLESILDASTNAPVGAFTDHPMMSRNQRPVTSYEPGARKSFYSLKPDVGMRNRSTEMLGDYRGSSPSLMLGNEGPSHSRSSSASHNIPKHDGGQDDPSPSPDNRSSMHLDTVGVLDDADHPDLEAEIPEEMLGQNERYTQPTTLLAELQIRKEHQRQRNKTAATAFPNGMRATLLELDAVAEVQKASRKFKRVPLAWEEPRGAEDGPPGDDDEEVPLGVLVPGAKSRPPEQERSSMFFGQRNASTDRLSRLSPDFGRENHPNPNRQTRGTSSHSAYRLEVPGLTGEEDHRRDEPLLQGMKRLTTREGGSPGQRPAASPSSDFAADLLSRFGGESPNEEAARKSPQKRISRPQIQRRVQSEFIPRPSDGPRFNRVMPPQDPRANMQMYPPTAAHPANVPSPGFAMPSSQLPQMTPEAFQQLLASRASYYGWRSTMGAAVAAPPWMGPPGGMNAIGAPPAAAGNIRQTWNNMPPMGYGAMNQSMTQLNAGPRASRGWQTSPYAMSTPLPQGTPAQGGIPHLQPPTPIGQQPVEQDPINRWRLHIQP